MTAHVLTDPEAQELLDLGVTPRDLVRLAWPDATDEQATAVLWQRTPYPLVDGVHDITDAVAAAYVQDQSLPDAGPLGGRLGPPEGAA